MPDPPPVTTAMRPSICSIAPGCQVKPNRPNTARRARPFVDGDGEWWDHSRPGRRTLGAGMPSVRHTCRRFATGVALAVVAWAAVAPGVRADQLRDARAAAARPATSLPSAKGAGGAG